MQTLNARTVTHTHAHTHTHTHIHTCIHTHTCLPICLPPLPWQSPPIHRWTKTVRTLPFFAIWFTSYTRSRGKCAHKRKDRHMNTLRRVLRFNVHAPFFFTCVAWLTHEFSTNGLANARLFQDHRASRQKVTLKEVYIAPSIWPLHSFSVITVPASAVRVFFINSRSFFAKNIEWPWIRVFY